MSRKKLSKQDAPTQITNHEKSLGQNDFIISKTNPKGEIIYCNQMFTKLAGYPAADLIGANHNLIRHPDMPRLAFKIAWEKIRAKKEFFGMIKNLCADGSHYWVFAIITPDLDGNGNITSYTSVRRKPPQTAVNKITEIYRLLRDAESRGGLDASQKVLDDYLAQQGVGYDEFIINLSKDIRV